MQLALTMSKPYPRELLLSAPWKSTEWNPRVVKELVEERMKPEECRITVASQKEIEGRKYEEKEKWYGTEYTIVPMSQKVLEVSCSSLCLAHVAHRVLLPTTAQDCRQLPRAAPTEAQRVRPHRPRNQEQGRSRRAGQATSIAEEQPRLEAVV